MRLVGVDSVDSSRSTSEQVTGVAEVSPAFKIEATVRLNECDHVVRVIVGPTWHVRIARLAIVLFVFVDMPGRPFRRAAHDRSQLAGDFRSADTHPQESHPLSGKRQDTSQ